MFASGVIHACFIQSGVSSFHAVLVYRLVVTCASAPITGAPRPSRLGMYVIIGGFFFAVLPGKLLIATEQTVLWSVQRIRACLWGCAPTQHYHTKQPPAGRTSSAELTGSRVQRAACAACGRRRCIRIWCCGRCTATRRGGVQLAHQGISSGPERWRSTSTATAARAGDSWWLTRYVAGTVAW